MSHNHHHHHHAGASVNRLIIVIALTSTILVAEVIGAWLSGSLALATDAGHMAADLLGIILALVAALIARRPRSQTYTWGLVRVEVLSATAQASMLLGVFGIVTWEAVLRLQSPHEIAAREMLIFAVVGLAANLVSLGVLASHRDSSLTLKAAFLEVLSDALGSVAVIAAALVTMTTGWIYADPVASLIVAGFMAPRAVIVLDQALNIILERTPDHLDLAQVEASIVAREEVIDVHDVHVSTIDSGTIVLTAHVTLTPECFTNMRAVTILHELSGLLTQRFGITHSTLQFDAAGHRDHEHLHEDHPEIARLRRRVPRRI